MISRTALRLPLAVAARPSTSFPRMPSAFSAARSYASGAGIESESKPSKPTTSTSHPTVPHTAPKPTPFFARKNIGLEVTPLIAFIATIATVATGFLVKNLLYDPEIHTRHGVENDAKLEKVLAMPDDAKDGKQEKKEEKK
ncbi:hypothetical protein JCM5353_003557 [Sporobolomyces roseus]